MTRKDFIKGSVCAGLSGAGGWAFADGRPVWLSDLGRVSPTANYWCTWRTQFRDRDPDERDARNSMNGKKLFGPDGWARTQFKSARDGLYFVLDDGWDVPFNANAGEGRHLFGSLEIDEGRFPAFKGTPGERLRQLNDAAKACGWRGAGLWVACQTAGDREHGGRVLLPREKFIEDTKRKLVWSQEAGIEYWKVDWGARSMIAEFRTLMYELKEKYAPSVRIEHAECQTVVNGIDAAPKDVSAPLTGSFRLLGDPKSAAREAFAKAVLANSDYFRTYDILTSVMGTATTLERCAFYLKCADAVGARSILSTEDEVYLAVGLGLSFGVMRADWPNWKPLPCHWRQAHRRLAEIRRAVRWDRLAPAFSSASGVRTLWSEKTKAESADLVREAHWYRNGWGRRVTQTAPAVMSRGLPIPVVRPVDGDQPFVVASRNPKTRAVAVAALASVAPGRMERTVPCDVEVKAALDEPVPFGVFGAFRSLTFDCGRKVRVFAQDLAGGEIHDITDRVVFADGRAILPGELVAKIGKEADRDLSEPGTLLWTQG